MSRSGRFYTIVSTVFIATALFALFAGCATAVDKGEVEQKANPVKDMHRDVEVREQAAKNAIQWYSYEEALVKARKEGKFVMVDFYATWCKWCKKLDSDTYADPRVVDALSADFVPVKIDAEASKKVVHEMKQMTMYDLANEYKVASFPSIWFIDKDGGKAKLLNGYLAPDDFLTYLSYIKGGKYKDMSFEDYAAKGGEKK